MDTLFSVLFKYRPFFFQQGQFGFESQLPIWLWGILACIAAGILLWTYRLSQTAISKQSTWNFLALRIAFVLLIIFILAQPSLTLSMLVPQQTSLAVLVDNSKSMGINDGDGPRGEPIKHLIANDSDFIRTLEDNFALKVYRFGGSPERLQGLEGLNWQDEQTNITKTLEQVLSESRNVPLGGIILLSDGSENSFRETTEVLSQLASRKIPVHTVGFGPETPLVDVEIESISLPRRLIPGSAALARVAVRHHGVGGKRARLEIRENNTLVESKEVQFPRGSNLLTEEIRLLPKNSGIKTYEFRLVTEDELSEKNLVNNTRTELIDVIDSKPKMLYVEGRPRWEYKFLRRALQDDESLHLESLLRTALNKFYRQGIEDETTLASGFPNSREQLFEYQGLIIGDVESAFFSYNQMELIRDFVGERGGGLLMLGGGSTFSAGGFQNTPVEEALPVWLDQSSRNEIVQSSYVRDDSRLTLTLYGSNHPSLQISGDSSENEKVWGSLPALTDRNIVEELKPGATLLAESVSLAADSGQKSPLLVSQRFGRGLSLVFLSGSSWRWQMLQDREDESHEIFWKQLLRWLVASASSPVQIELDKSSFEKHEPVSIRTLVHDKAFHRMNNASVDLTITAPSGDQTVLNPQWDSREEGVYTIDWLASSDGIYKISASAKDNMEEADLGGSDAYLLVSSGKAEFFGATQKRSFLENIAKESGGRYYTLDNVENLPEEVLYTESQSSTTQVLDLWNMPINLLLLLTLPILEWVMRRRKGMI